MFSRVLVTLDFDGSTLRWLSARKGEILRWNRVHLQTMPASGGQVDNAMVAEELAGVFQAEGLPKNRVVTAVSGQRSIFRTITLPVLDETLLEAAVHRKVRQEIPLPPHDTDLSWTVIGRADGQLSIYVVATPREEIDQQMAILHAAGIQAAGMDVRPLALVRAVNQEEAIIVGLEDLGLTIVVVVDGLPQIIRTVPLGAAAPGPEGRLELLGQELLRTTKFYNESHKSRPLPAATPLYLTGDGFRESVMVERMQARSPYPRSPLNPPVKYPSGLPVEEFSVNIGLALKDV